MINGLCGIAETVQLDLPATFKYLHVISRCLNDMLTQEEDMDEQEIISHDVQLAVQEICTNIIRHAYAHSNVNERIHVAITLCSDNLVVETVDKGQMFDETTVREPNLEEGQVHGYGLFIIKSLMDEVTYSRQHDCNHWRLAKNL
jgi:serine/threonine-protein kinase RsbW